MNIQDTLSFDDILINPRLSNIESRKDISLKTHLTKNVALHLPLISSPMDTITEDKMAIEMALNGGLGIIHRYNTIEQQVHMVKQVKRYLTYINENPYTILHTDTINILLQKIEKHKVYSYLVTNNENELLGIVTKRDLNTHIIQKGDNNNLITSIMTDVLKMKIISTSDLFTMEDHINY
jgi:IMP dehydrogenase